MPKIRSVNPDAPLPDFSTQGTQFSIGGLTLDFSEFYAANKTTVEVRADAEGNAVVGGSGPYLAVAEIPAAQFEETDGGRQLTPLDPRNITIHIWPGA